jgi:hypothetical protein
MIEFDDILLCEVTKIVLSHEFADFKKLLDPISQIFNQQMRLPKSFSPH